MQVSVERGSTVLLIIYYKQVYTTYHCNIIPKLVVNLELELTKLEAITRGNQLKV